jgi:peptidoglycan/xylan/chitin deacetylase (PgdA/CDA1 family)
VVEVGGHTVRHLRLTAVDPALRVREVRECKRFLEELTGRPVTAFSYPHGAFDPAVRDDVRRAGYRVGCSSVPDVGRSPRERMSGVGPAREALEGVRFPARARTLIPSTERSVP